MIFKRLAVLLAAVWLTIVTASSATPRQLTKTVRHVMGENDSRQAVRERALAEVKRQALEEAGVFVEAATALKELTKEGASSIKSDSEFQSDIQQITAGVTKSEISKEDWKTEDNVVVLYLTCRVTVDPEDVNERISQIMKSRQKLGATDHGENEIAGMKAELQELKLRMDAKPDGSTAGNMPTADVAADMAAARSLYDRGLYSDSQTIVQKKVLADHDTCAEAHLLLGQIYAQKKGWYSLAVRELERAIELNPKSIQARVVLADTQYRVGRKNLDAKHTLEDALILAPGNKDIKRLLDIVSQ